VATLEERVSRLEGAYEQVDRRLEEMNNRFNNLYILIGGSWVTLMYAIIALYLKI
jgi:hypothetical protein